ncbi:MAG: PLP-dependent cysteine synthase family protein [Christensenellales bacterium]
MDEQSFKSILTKIGKTPLVESGIDRVYAKLEKYNPAGSIKDRAALFMLINGFKAGKLNKGIVEATSGNTGIGLAYIAGELKVKCVIVMPDNMSLERRKMIASYGAELVLTPAAEGMAGAVKRAKEIEQQGFYFVNQFGNTGNALAHYYTTAPEVFKQLPTAKWIVAGIGSGGTVMGFKKYVLEKGLDCKVCGVEPLSSPLISKGKAGPHKIQGIGANFIPDLLDVNRLDKVIAISDDDAFDYIKWFNRRQKEKVGISSGAVLAAAELLAEKTDGDIVAILADGGDRYPDELYV